MTVFHYNQFLFKNKSFGTIQFPLSFVISFIHSFIYFFIQQTYFEYLLCEGAVLELFWECEDEYFKVPLFKGF